MVRGHLFAVAVVGGFMGTAAQATILPENNLYLQDCLDCETGLTEAQFTAINEKGRQLFGSIVTAAGGTLNIRGNWTDATVNASASQMFGTWQVNMYGGLARRAEVTPDGFTLVLCHELGHHLAGFPYVSSWGANEGQSDYWATNHCALKFWGDDTAGNAAARATVDPFAKNACDSVWQTQDAQDICYRAAMGGKSLATLLGALRNQTVNWDTPDTSVVTTTNHAHPAAQCRLDTYTAGALCTSDYDQSVIPGKRNGRGYNDRAAEENSAEYSCTARDEFTVGLRPTCWFKPTL